MYIKYPKTYHLPWSESVTKDDKIITDLSFMEGDIVITEKMDGENTTIYKDFVHARSIDSDRHESRSFVKLLASSFQYIMSENIRVCGENMYAKHYIFYTNLQSYFLGFAIFDSDNFCLSWKDTVNIFNNLGIKHVPVIYEGSSLSEDEIKKVTKHITDNRDRHEGYVIRVAEKFHFNDFSSNIAKYVRKDHVNTDIHWKNSVVIKNILND